MKVYASNLLLAIYSWKTMVLPIKSGNLDLFCGTPENIMFPHLKISTGNCICKIEEN